MIKKEEKTKKKTKIEVDQDFLDLILKSNKETQESIRSVSESVVSMQQEIIKLKKPSSTPAPVLTESKKDYTFQLNQLTYFDKPPQTPEEIAQFRIRLNDFREKLLNLMKTYRIGQINVSILKKL